MTPERTIGQMFWDHTMDDLRNGLIRIIETTRMDEELLVLGVIGFLLRTMGAAADPDELRKAVARNKDMIQFLQEQKSLPIEQRRQPSPDGEIDQLIEKIRGFLAGSETGRAAAEETHSALETAFNQTYTSDFWSQWRLEHTKGYLGTA
jgi:hypothetical protein